jgi:choline dehydrogenase-like flavoprotein
MPTNLKPTDIVIVGMGAAGGVAALPLAQAGLKVIGLEAGTWLTSKDFAPDELRNNYRAWPQSVQKANREVPTHRPDASAPYSPRPAFHPMMNGVGGTSLHYWAQSWRLSPWDFKVVSETTKRYGASRLPRGSTVEDWPFGIEEIERYYDIAERELGVSVRRATSEARSIAAATSSKRRAVASTRCPAQVDRLARQDGGCSENTRMESVSRAGGDQHALLSRIARAARITVSARGAAATSTPRGRPPSPRSEGAEDRQPRSRHRSARHRSERR